MKIIPTGKNVLVEVKETKKIQGAIEVANAINIHFYIKEVGPESKFTVGTEILIKTEYSGDVAMVNSDTKDFIINEDKIVAIIEQ